MCGKLAVAMTLVPWQDPFALKCPAAKDLPILLLTLPPSLSRVSKHVENDKVPRALASDFLQTQADNTASVTLISCFQDGFK